MNKRSVANKLSVVLLAAGLAGCNGTKDRKAIYMEQGNKLYQAGDYDKAQLAFKNLLQIDPNNSEVRYLLAETLSKQGKIKEAFEHYKAVMNADAAHVMSRIRAGQLFLLNGRLEEARQLADEALSLAPNNVNALVFQAAVLAANNSSDTAIVSVEKALQIKPDSSDAILMLASIYTKSGNDDKAIRRLQQAMAKDPDNEAMQLMLANLFVKNQMKDEAEKALKKLVELKPDNPLNYRRLVSFYASNEQLDQAEHVLRDSVKRFPDDDKARMELVDFLYKARNVDTAIAELLPLIDRFPAAYELRFKLADFQLKKGELENAESTLKEVISADEAGPFGIKARNALARLYVAGKRPNEAKSLMLDVLNENPRDAEALTLRGQFALAEGKTDEAIGDFRSVLVDQPNNVQVLKLLASSHVANNDLLLARENMEKVVTASPLDIQARQDLVELLFRLGKPSQTEQHINTLLSIDSKNTKALEYLFKLRLAKKDWTKAQQATEAIRQLTDNDASAYYMSGLAYQAEGKLERSIAAFKESLKLKSDAIEPLTQLIKSYIALDRIDQAIDQLNKIIKRDGSHFVAYNLLGEVYLQDRKLKEADRAFNQAIKIKPEWFHVYRNLAKVELLKKNKSAAINVLREGLEKTNQSIELIKDLATLLHNEGKHDEVIKLYEEAYKKYPDSVVTINNLASYLTDYGNDQESLKRAAELSEPFALSNNPNMLDTAAWIAFKQGSYIEAQQLLEKAVELGPISPVISYHLGMVYYKQGDNNSAKSYLSKAISTSENFKGIEQAREILHTIERS